MYFINMKRVLKDITVASHESHGVLNDHKLDC